MHGQQVLSELKAEPATAAIPVIVLSSGAYGAYGASGAVVRRALCDGALAGTVALSDRVIIRQENLSSAPAP